MSSAVGRYIAGWGAVLFALETRGAWERPAGPRVSCPVPTELQDLMPISRARKPAFILSSMRDEKRT